MSCSVYSNLNKIKADYFFQARLRLATRVIAEDINEAMRLMEMSKDTLNVSEAVKRYK